MTITMIGDSVAVPQLFALGAVGVGLLSLAMQITALMTAGHDSPSIVARLATCAAALAVALLAVGLLL